MPASREKEERMWKLADKFARSGEYTSWHLIEAELRQLGYSRARQLLDNERVRESLNALCREAQKAKSDSKEISN